MVTPHFILDMETMGTDTQKCVVLDCSYFVFDWDRFTSNNPYTFTSLLGLITRAKFDVSDQVTNLKYEIEPDTLNFWQQQEPKVRKKILPSDEDITVETFLNKLNTDLEKVNYWWSRSNSFDPPILWRLAKDHGVRFINTKLPHWKLRDTRTYIDAKTNFTIKQNGFCPIEDQDAWSANFEQHSSVHDVAADILRLQTIVRIENDLGWSVL